MVALDRTYGNDTSPPWAVQQALTIIVHSMLQPVILDYGIKKMFSRFYNGAKLNLIYLVSM